MKRIDKDCLHGGAGRMLAEGLKTTETNKAGTPVKRMTLSLPRRVHAIACEVAFRNEYTLKKLVMHSLTEMLNDSITGCGSYDFGHPAQPSILLPREIFKQMRQVAHDLKIPQRLFITEALVRYIRDHYRDSNQDIPGINDF